MLGPARCRIGAVLLAGLLSGCSVPGASPAPGPSPRSMPSPAQVRAAEHRATHSVERLSTALEDQYAATVVYPSTLRAVRSLARSRHLLAPGTQVRGWSVHPIVRHEWFALCVQTSVAGRPVSARYDSRDYGNVPAGPGAC
ncbi:hypothetical protein GCM10027076_21110 [Nocardioides montaniterrae]